MNRELFARVSEIFLEARSLSEQARASFLDLRCSGRADLREAVEDMLREDGHRSDGLDDSAMAEGIHLDAFQGLFTAGGSRHDSTDIPAPALPEFVGRYRIVRKLGEGGMGIVCEAEQDNPRRSVAIKLLKLGIGSAALLRRFRHEAQILARLQHPGIARVYDAGTLDIAGGSQAYFAMELISGRPLLEHAAEAKLHTRDRLLLFVAICDAVEYAHQKGVIHRDLKPSNIMVDEHGAPRVLDFGVARATDADIQATTLHTHSGQLVGTLPYMSPEQIGGDIGAVDTRSDVYALGVVLFQLLSGRLPLDTRSKTIAEAARIIRDQEPTRLGSLDTAFRGDLETIVSRALDKDAARRYQSVAALASDVHRHLRHEPIEARPASKLYQIGKFARRHPEFILGGSLAVVCLLAGMIGTSWGLLRATHQRDSANLQAKRAHDAQVEAEQSAARATQLAASLRHVLAAAQPRGGGAANESMTQVLVKCADDIRDTLASQPEVEWDVRTEIGKSLRSLGAYRESLKNFLLAHAIAEREFGGEDTRTLSTARLVALAYADSQAAYLITTQESAAGEELTLKSYQSSRRVLGERHSVTLSFLDCAATLQSYAWKYREAIKSDRSLVDALRLVPQDERPAPLSAVLGRLACNLAGAQEDQEAAACAEEALTLLPMDLERWAPRDTGEVTHQWLPQVEYLWANGRAQVVVKLLRAHLDRTDAALGHHHAATCIWRVRLFECLRDMGDTESAISLMRQHIGVQQRILPRDDDPLAWDNFSLAKALATHGQFEESETTFWAAIDIARHSKKRDLGWFAQEIWRHYQVGLGLATYRRWPSESLRLESRIIMEAALRRLPTSFDKTSPNWSELTYRLVKHGGPSEERSPGLHDLLSHAEPEPGLYRFDLGVPFDGKEVRGGDWILVAPWRIQRYAHHCNDLTNSERWRDRLRSSPDDRIDSNTLTGVGWWEHGLGPFGMQYSYGLVADTTIDLPSGPYRVTLIADDGGTLDIDGRRVISAWTDEGVYSEFKPSPPSSRTWTTTIDLTPGPHAFHVEYVQWGGESKLQLRIEPLTGDGKAKGPDAAANTDQETSP